MSAETKTDHPGAERDFTLRWHNCPEIPPIVVARFRAAGRKEAG
jgi:hypothetical protein